MSCEVGDSQNRHVEYFWAQTMNRVDNQLRTRGITINERA